VSDTKKKDEGKTVEWFCHLEYEGLASPPIDRFADALLEGRILGQRCSQCGKVFIGPKDFCPLDAIELDESHDIECEQKGTVAGYTIVKPVDYYGQQETENFARVSVVLDSGGSMIQQQLVEVPLADVRVGMRVEAVWKPEADRTLEDLGGMGGVGVHECLAGWIPTGEPDVDAELMKGQAW
jgi:uncharacterized OB-fold protein